MLKEEGVLGKSSLKKRAKSNDEGIFINFFLSRTPTMGVFLVVNL